jgi:type II secretory pathway component PulJ
MNLLEVLVAAVVVAGASCGSAQVLGMGSRWSLQAEQRQQRLERQEAAMVAAEAAVRRLAEAAPRAGACGAAAAELAAALEQPSGESGDEAGPTRQVVQEEEQVLLEVAGEGDEPPRRRLFSPAALGLCGGGDATAI